ncbi:hypothetical protein LSAT2_021946 [Lamellibrachia satsuma]|nr:hypothetical protein LSAT2_021946 [Lamellibrachia satsuma]
MCGITWCAVQCFCLHQERTTSELLNVTVVMDVNKLPGNRSSVVLFLMLAIFCCQFPKTPAGYMIEFISCMMSCSTDAKECTRHCEENNTCEASQLLNATDVMDVKLSIGRSGVVLLLLVAIFCCQSPVTTAADLVRYMQCMSACTKDAKDCMHHCDENNTCAASRKFCKKLCFSRNMLCEMRCFEEHGK